MKHMSCRVICQAAIRSRSRARWSMGLLVLTLNFPGVAYPYTLEQLLCLPLERLLRLKISAPKSSRMATLDAGSTQRRIAIREA
jgi:hypothetical protein